MFALFSPRANETDLTIVATIHPLAAPSDLQRTAALPRSARVSIDPRQDNAVVLSVPADDEAAACSAALWAASHDEVPVVLTGLHSIAVTA